MGRIHSIQFLARKRNQRSLGKDGRCIHSGQQCNVATALHRGRQRNQFILRGRLHGRREQRWMLQSARQLRFLKRLRKRHDPRLGGPGHGTGGKHDCRCTQWCTQLVCYKSHRKLEWSNPRYHRENVQRLSVRCHLLGKNGPRPAPDHNPSKLAADSRRQSDFQNSCCERASDVIFVGALQSEALYLLRSLR